MATVEVDIPRLMAGDKLTRAEFLRRWEAMPLVKHAELIGGTVYIPSPLGPDHSVLTRRASHWLSAYEMATPVCEGGNDGTWEMLGDSPQPDLDLRLKQEYTSQ